METRVKKPRRKQKRVTNQKVVGELKDVVVRLRAVEREARKAFESILLHSKKIDEFNKRIDNMEETILMVHTNVRRSRYLHEEREEGLRVYKHSKTTPMTP
jgi:predicted  nucleic acid-binding Zn-ribbon protein